MLTVKQINIVEHLKGLAEKNYDNGWGFFVECYSNPEWYDFMISKYGFHDPITTKKEAIAKAKELVKLEKEKELNQLDW
jgi:hypothetical protein